MKCVYIKRKLKTFLQIFRRLLQNNKSNILQKDILTAIIQSKVNEIKM